MDRRVASLVLAILLLPAAAAAQEVIAPERANDFVGKSGKVCGKIESARHAQNAEGQPTFLHLGAPFPKHSFQVRILGKNRARFTTPPETLVGFDICVSGNIVNIGGRPEIEIDSPSAMVME